MNEINEIEEWDDWMEWMKLMNEIDEWKEWMGWLKWMSTDGDSSFPFLITQSWMNHEWIMNEWINTRVVGDGHELCLVGGAGLIAKVAVKVGETGGASAEQRGSYLEVGA